jgi:flagellar FliL protein
MADKDETTEGTEEEAAAPGKPWLLILIIALLSGGGGAAGGMFLSGGNAEVAEASAEAGAKEGEEGAEAHSLEKENFGERVFALDPFVVNITSEGYPRYLKLKLELELDRLETKEEAEQRLAQVRDTIILLLSSKRLTDISEFEGKALLKDDIRNRINGILQTGQVNSVLFTELVVQ